VVYFSSDGRIQSCVILGIAQTKQHAEQIQLDWLLDRARELGQFTFALDQTPEIGLYAFASAKAAKTGDIIEVRRKILEHRQGYLWSSVNIKDVLIGYIGVFKKSSLMESIHDLSRAFEHSKADTMTAQAFEYSKAIPTKAIPSRQTLLEELAASENFRHLRSVCE